MIEESKGERNIDTGCANIDKISFFVLLPKRNRLKPTSILF